MAIECVSKLGAACMTHINVMFMANVGDLCLDLALLRWFSQQKLGPRQGWCANFDKEIYGFSYWFRWKRTPFLNQFTADRISGTITDFIQSENGITCLILRWNLLGVAPHLSMILSSDPPPPILFW